MAINNKEEYFHLSNRAHYIVVVFIVVVAVLSLPLLLFLL